MTQPDPDKLLPVTEPSVPVFDCHVIVSPADESGIIRVRAAAVDGITATGPTERDALIRIVADFKKFVARHAEAGSPIPWTDPPDRPAEGESERWIPVHL